MCHRIADIDGLDDRRVAESPGVERLAAGGGVEGGPIEHDGRAPVVLEETRHDGLEPGAVRIAVVDPLRHAGLGAAGSSK